MIYTTQYVMNLYTGKPFSLEVPDADVERLKLQASVLKTDEVTMPGITLAEFITLREFSFFPSYTEVLKIFSTNGYTEPLMRQILGEFGVPEAFIQRLLEDEKFVGAVKPWFEGITCDGERAARTLSIVYDVLKGYFNLHPIPTWVP